MFASLFLFLLSHKNDGEHEDDVANELADCGPENNAPYVGSQDAERDGDGGAEDRKEREGSYPRTFLLHIITRLAQATFLDVHPFGNLLDTADASEEVVEHRPEHVADGAADDGEQRIHPCGGEQSTHHRLRTEGDEGACQERRHRHSEIAVFDEKLIE